jgi:hypothetical protein
VFLRRNGWDAGARLSATALLSRTRRGSGRRSGIVLALATHARSTRARSPTPASDIVKKSIRLRRYSEDCSRSTNERPREATAIELRDTAGRHTRHRVAAAGPLAMSPH